MKRRDFIKALAALSVAPTSMTASSPPVPSIDPSRPPDVAAAISIPFATLPLNTYIRGPRFKLYLDQALTRELASQQKGQA